MIDPSAVFNSLKEKGVGVFSGVPDSLLKDFCAYVTTHTSGPDHVITANEGAAVGIAAGHHLATGGLGLVYMQNSGLGNVVNPLLSLADPDVYSIPMLLLVGWRGEPGVRDEPQHVKQGRVTLQLLECMEIPHRLLSDDPQVAESDLAWAVATARDRSAPVALVVRKGTFSPCKLESTGQESLSLSRERAIECLVDEIEPRAMVVSTTGMISRELFEIRKNQGQPPGLDFLTVGSMGHASSIAFGVAAQVPDRSVYCFDGDGSVLMHLGSIAVLGGVAPANFKHIVINNGCHDSVGGQPTVGFDIALGRIAEACGYTCLECVEDEASLRAAMARLRETDGPVMLEIRVRKGARSDLGRPTTTPLENKEGFMRTLGAVD
ncbi:MAG: phosphonopyruvate decarboxylase [Verrucomicrobia bacterium]|nr:MAG: phosphonopyruvate decarboxylase [Verrucomicrobiota bacterium]